jgi:PKD repeat protein
MRERRATIVAVITGAVVAAGVFGASASAALAVGSPPHITTPTDGQHFDLSGGQAQIPWSVDVVDNCGGSADLNITLTDSTMSVVDGQTFQYNGGANRTESGTFTAPRADSYNVAANYTSDCAGGNDTVNITVGPPAFTWSPVSGAPRGTVHFAVSAPDAGNTYQWDFGDGETGTGTAPTHLYKHLPADGKATVTLTATGASPRTSSMTIVPPACQAVGVLDVCADSWDGGALTGGVTFDGGITAGDGPFDYDSGAHTLTSRSAVPLKVGTFSVGQAKVELDGDAHTDPLSETQGLGRLRVLSDGNLDPLHTGALQLTLTPLELYVDKTDGGALLGSYQIVFPPVLSGMKILGGGLGAGVYASGQQLRLKGGKLDVQIGFGEESSLTGKIEYKDGKFTIGGGLSAPGLFPVPGLEGIQASGTIDPDHFPYLDGLSVTAEVPVPLGESGFVLDEFKLEEKDLLSDPAFIGGVGGYWGFKANVLGFEVSPFKLEKADLSLETKNAGITLEGEGSVINKALIDGSLKIHGELLPQWKVTGQEHLKINLRPLLEAEGNGQVVFSGKHFTRTSREEIRAFGFRAAGRDVLSERGYGFSFSVPCPWTKSGHCTYAAETRFRPPMLPPVFTTEGADPNRLVTTSAKSKSRAFEVPRRRPFLTLEATGKNGPPDFVAIDPRGGRHSTSHPGAGASVSRDERFDRTGMLIRSPRPGTWHVQIAGQGVDLRIEPVKAVDGVHFTKGGPRTSKGHRLRRTGKAFAIRWRSQNLPRGTRVDVYAAAQKGQLGSLLKGGLKPSGALKLSPKRLRPGANYLTLVTVRGGLKLDFVTAARPVWVALNRRAAP